MARRPQLAAQDDAALLYGSDADRMRAMAALKQSGVRKVRLNAIYGKYSKADGGYDFSNLDRTVNGLRGLGIKTQMTLMGDPSYDGKPVPSRLSASNADPKEMARYAQATAKHFKGRVGQYDVWNEPNHPYFLQSRTPAKTYRKLYDAGVMGIRSVDKKAQVDFGELAPLNVNQFIRRSVGKGGVQASAIALHPYGDPRKKSTRKGSGDITHLGEVQKLIARLHKQGKLTNFHGGRAGLDLTEYGVDRKVGSEAQRIAIMHRAYGRARKAGARELTQYQIGGPKKDATWDTALPIGRLATRLARRR